MPRAEVERLRAVASSRAGRQPGDPPLKGIKVLDLGSAITAPLCCCILADLGADVVKVEAVGRGDGVRFLGPLRNGLSAYFHLLNRGKRAIQIDGKSASGQAVIHRLIKDADVFVQNWRPGVDARMGCTYEQLSAINPDLIYLAISGFGQTGPYLLKKKLKPNNPARFTYVENGHSIM